MRYKMILAAAILLISTPAYPQRASPLVVEVLKPNPTVVITQQVFKLTYRVRFLDLSTWGKEVIVLADNMQPESIPVFPFEAVSLEIDDSVKNRDVFIWDFKYTFRIMNEEKGDYVFPALTFYWLLRDIGQDIGSLEVQERETEEVSINYVSTVVDDPYISIRDDFNFKNFSGSTSIMGILAIISSFAFFTIGSYLALLIFGFIKPRKSIEKDTDDEVSESNGEEHQSFVALRSFRALNRTIKSCRKVSMHGNDNLPDNDWLISVERELNIGLKTLILAEVDDLNVGHTPKEILAHIRDNIKSGFKKDYLMSLAQKLYNYQEDIELNIPNSMGHNWQDVNTELTLLHNSLNCLRLRNRLLAYIRNTPSLVKKFLFSFRRRK